MHPTAIGIIGTAGREPDGAKMTKQLFDSMLTTAEHIITKQLKLEWENIMLVSGGAAWSDHVAVQLNLLYDCGLTLFLPCGWDDQTSKFIDTAESDWRKNPGRSANRYHDKFMSITGYEPFKDIQVVMLTGGVIDTGHHGFHARNTAIAKNSDILIAFSWAAGDAPTDGGTLDTWRKCKARLKIHVSLRDLLVSPKINIVKK